MPGGGLTAPKKLSPELADIVGKKEASRAELMKLLWAYIKKNNLQVTWPLFQYIFCLRGQNRSRISPILADFTSLSISCPIPGIFIQFPGFHFYSDQVLTSTDSTAVSGSRQQAVLHPRQEDGQGLRLGQDARLRHGQAHRSPPLLRLKKTRRRTTSRICLQHFLYQVVEYKLNLADEIFNRTTLFRLPLTVTAIKCEVR